MIGNSTPAYPLADEIVLKLSVESQCAKQLAQATGSSLTDVYAALVHLDDSGRAAPDHRKKAIPGFGLARYWNLQ